MTNTFLVVAAWSTLLGCMACAGSKSTITREKIAYAITNEAGLRPGEITAVQNKSLLDKQP